MNSERVCVGLCSSFCLREESVGAVFVPEVGDCVSDCDVTECVLVGVFDLTASSDFEGEIFSVSSAVSQLNLAALQTYPFLEKRGASGTLLSEQSTRAKRSFEGPPVQAVPEAVSAMCAVVQSLKV